MPVASMRTSSSVGLSDLLISNEKSICEASLAMMEPLIDDEDMNNCHEDDDDDCNERNTINDIEHQKMRPPPKKKQCKQTRSTDVSTTTTESMSLSDNSNEQDDLLVIWIILYILLPLLYAQQYLSVWIADADAYNSIPLWLPLVGIVTYIISVKLYRDSTMQPYSLVIKTTTAKASSQHQRLAPETTKAQCCNSTSACVTNAATLRELLLLLTPDIVMMINLLYFVFYRHDILSSVLMIGFINVSIRIAQALSSSVSSALNKQQSMKTQQKNVFESKENRTESSPTTTPSLSEESIDVVMI